MEGRLEKVERLLHKGDPGVEAAREALRSFSDWLVVLLWARLPQCASSRGIELLATGGERHRVDQDAPTAEQIRSAGAYLLAAAKELAGGGDLVGIRCLIHEQWGESIASCPEHELHQNLDAARAALAEARKLLGDRFGLQVVDGLLKNDDEPRAQAKKPLSGADRLRLKLAQQNQLGLFDALCGLEGHRIGGGRYEIREPFAAGGQNVVLAGVDMVEMREVAIKFARFDYSRPAGFGIEEIRRARVRMQRAWNRLAVAPCPWFPEPLALLVAPLPLHDDSRPRWVRDEELFLVEELVDGKTLSEEASARFARRKGEPSGESDRFTASVARQMLEALAACAAMRPRLLYTDLSPRNVVVRPTGRIALVDASSLAITDPPEPTAWATRAFLPADKLAAADRGEPIAFDERTLLYGLGKSLHTVISNREALEGVDPDLSDAAFAACSPVLRALVIDLCSGRFETFREALGLAVRADELVRIVHTKGEEAT